ncbi:MAG: hypothetical protein ACXVGH_07845, partial [Mycobacteriales bacterium]
AAPMSAAGLAVVEGRTLSGPLGNVLPALYAHPSAFRDVTTGTNGAWTAGPGYDRVTGLGVPDWTAVATAMALGGVTTSPSPSPSPTASPTDVAAPTTGLRVTWTGSTSPTYRVDRTFSDPLPSSGFGTFTLTTLDRTTGVTTTTGSTATSSTLRVQPGHSYTLTATSTDLAGHTSAPVSAAFRAPSDDRALGFSSGWSRQLAGNDYSGTHTVSAAAGQTVRLVFTGRTATVSFLRTSSSGYADVYVDGVRTGRLDLYSATTQFRSAVRVMAGSYGRHVVALRVVGAHRAASSGSRVYVDSFSWA